MTAKALVAENLRRLLKDTGLKDFQVAAVLGINPGVLSRWLSGHTGPSWGHLDLIAQRLQWPLAELFRDRETPYGS